MNELEQLCEIDGHEWPQISAYFMPSYEKLNGYIRIMRTCLKCNITEDYYYKE